MRRSAGTRAGRNREERCGACERSPGGSVEDPEPARLIGRHSGQWVIHGGGQDAHVVVGQWAEDEVRGYARLAVAVDAVLSAWLGVRIVAVAATVPLHAR